MRFEAVKWKKYFYEQLYVQMNKYIPTIIIYKHIFSSNWKYSTLHFGIFGLRLTMNRLRIYRKFFIKIQKLKLELATFEVQSEIRSWKIMKQNYLFALHNYACTKEKGAVEINNVIPLTL